MPLAEAGADPAPPAHLPPVYEHYYFAVLVDAASGEVLTWQQDETGKLAHDCEMTTS